MEPIRILHIVTSMEIGGIESFLMAIYRQIDRSRIQFDFLKHRSKKGFYEEEIERLGGRIYCVPPLNPLKQLAYDRALSAFFREHKHTYPVVHAHMNTFSAFPLRIAKKEGIPVRIAHSHSVPNVVNYRTPFVTVARIGADHYATDGFACSEAAGKWMFRKRSYTLIPNAIDAQKFCPDEQSRKEIREEFGLTDGFVIGMVANFSAIKNHRFLLPVFEKVLKKIPNARLLLVGEGSCKEDIITLAQQANIQDKVIFAGKRSDIPKMLNAMDVFVLPSFTEGFPVSVLEAETAGLPCVLSAGVPTDVKIFPDMPTTFLPLDNEDLWVETICSLQDHPKKSLVNEVSDTPYHAPRGAQILTEFYEKKYRENQNR